jgi:hypothetical protein
MKNVQLRQWQRLQAIQLFFQRHAFKDARLRSVRLEVDELLIRIRELQVRQHSRGASLSRDGFAIRTLTEELREDHLLPIARRGKSLVRNQPKREEMLRVPHKKAHSTVMAAHATALAAWLKPFERTFVAAGFEKNFLARLRAATKALVRRSKVTGTAQRERSQATAALGAALQRGNVLKDAIDGLLQPHFRKDPDLRDHWESAKRLSKRAGRPKKKRGPDKEKPS